MQKYDIFKVLLQYRYQGHRILKISAKYMKLIGFRTAKPRKFSYKPLYYDPVKEEQDKLKERFNNASEGMPDSELRMRIRLRMNRKKLDERIRKRSRMMSILFTLLLLLMILYYIFLK